jgi:hypothetical protein
VVSSGKRWDMRELKRDELFKSFMDMQREKLSIEAEIAASTKTNATTRAKLLSFSRRRSGF